MVIHQRADVTDVMGFSVAEKEGLIFPMGNPLDMGILIQGICFTLFFLFLGFLKQIQVLGLEMVGIYPIEHEKCSDGSLFVWDMTSQKTVTRSNVSQGDHELELAGGLEPWNLMTFHYLGMSSSQLTNSYYSEGFGQPPTNILWKITIFNGYIHYKLPFSIAILVINQAFALSKHG